MRRKYVSEDAVKHALHINSFRNLSKDKIMQFASMIPYIDKDVAIAIINQFPTFVDFGKIVISNCRDICLSILEKNQESHADTIHGYQKVLDVLAKRLEAEDLTETERASITKEMISIADKIAEEDHENKRFLERITTKIVQGVTVVVGIIGTSIGVVFAIKGSGDLPNISDQKKL